jgi:glycosyltransferase involved in cell wall biosynthesis
MGVRRPSIAFISTMEGGPWGGSEELWSQTALRLASKNIEVCASVRHWEPPHQRIVELLHRGATVQQRPPIRQFGARAWRKLFASNKTHFAAEIERWLQVSSPSLVVLSAGDVVPPIDVMELCVEKRWPFVTVGHNNSDSWWPHDELAERFRELLPMALRCYFVAHANRQLVENHLSFQLNNAEIVHNPFNVAIDASPAWPVLEDGELKMSCVGRLEPSQKGQDILIEALAAASWKNRPWLLRFYGDGPSRTGLERFARSFGLQERVRFLPHTNRVENIWSDNHVLVVPSRFEGLPLVIVEAMLCARPVLATSVGGINEIVEDGVTGFIAEVPTVNCIRDGLDRMWARRGELKGIGSVAAQSIRALIPADPIEVFSNKLLEFIR